MDWTEKVSLERAKLKKEHLELFQKIVEILFRHDPVYINFETNDDEYEPEAGTIIPGLESCSNHTDVRKVIYEEFIRWFYDDIGEESEYEEVAKEIWQAWQTHQSKPE